MLGFADFWVELAVWLSLLSALLCVVYGIMKWNRGARRGAPSSKTMIWIRDAQKMEEEQ